MPTTTRRPTLSLALHRDLPLHIFMKFCYNRCVCRFFFFGPIPIPNHNGAMNSQKMTNTTQVFVCVSVREKKKKQMLALQYISIDLYTRTVTNGAQTFWATVGV